MILPLTPLRFLDRARTLYRHKVGVVCGAQRFTFGQFFERCCRLAGALCRIGVRPTERVAYLSYNCHRLLEGYYGVLLAKAVLLPINIRLAPPEIAFILKDSGARVLFLDPDFLPLVAGIREELPGVSLILLEDVREAPPWVEPKTYESLLGEWDPARFEFMDIEDSSLAELFYTSGTTGNPKGVMLSHRTVYLHALNLVASLPFTDRTSLLHTIPLFHANGWGNAHTATVAGATHVMIRKFDPQDVCRLIEAEKINFFSMVPTMATLLVHYADLGHYDLSSVEWVKIGGAAASQELLQEVQRKLGCKAYSGYGLTETSPVLTVAWPRNSVPALSAEEQIRYQASTGHPLIGAEVRVVDEAGRDVPKDGRTVGEIVARGDLVMDGYWRSPEETKAAFRDGWFLTGDMAVWDEAGYLTIVDRKKEIIVSGGENISSIEVEKALVAHPCVYECAVVAVPDELWGEVPKAFVVLKDEGAVSEADLTAFLKERLAKYKIPHSFEFVPSLPKGGTGKIQKKVLREKYWAGQPKRIH